MKPDILFWFYKDFDTCKKKLQKVRALNKNVKVFALYGGPKLNAPKAQKKMGHLCDDFFIYPYKKSSRWKWFNGDHLLMTWFQERGRHLNWDTIFIMQWDMLILAPLDKLFNSLNKGEILLSGYRQFDEVSNWWPWANPSYSELELFKQRLQKDYNYYGELFACLFIVACLPRIYFEKCQSIGYPKPGFLEYKIPTMARVFDIPVCKNHKFKPWWNDHPVKKNTTIENIYLSATKYEIPLWVILNEIWKSSGMRIFHPYSDTLPKVYNYRYISLIASCIYKSSYKVKLFLQHVIKNNISYK